METKTKIKIIIIGCTVIITLLFLLYILSNNKSDVDTNALESYHSAKQNESKSIKEADKWLNYDEKNAGASTGSILSNEQTNNQKYTQPIEDITDDPDAVALYKTQERIRNSKLSQQQQEQYAPQQQKAVIQSKVIKEEKLIQPQEQQEEEQTEEPKKPRGNRFYEGKRRERKGNTFACVVHGEQEVMNGSTLKLRLMDEYTTPTGVLLQKGTTLWGVCTLTKDRMNVSVQSVLKGKDLIDLNFIVYDIDGLMGINLPNNVKAEIAKRAKAQAIQEAPTDQIIGNNGVLEKGANAVVNTTKNILSRKQAEIKILVKSNYQLVLKPI